MYFIRAYELLIGDSNENLLRQIDGIPTETHTPLQIQFMIDQSPNAEHSYAEITLYGLKRVNRRAIYEEGSFVTLSAGWKEDGIGTIFDGQIRNVELGRDGADQFLRLYCQSGFDQWRKAKIFKTWAADTPMKQIIREVAESFGYPVELIGDFDGYGKALKGRTFARDAKSALRSLAKTYGFTFGLLNNRLYVIRDEARRRDIPATEYTPTTGLIGTPEITEKGVDIDVLLNPFLRPWDSYTVKSETGALTYNAIYYQEREFPETQGESENEIVSLKHEGDFYSDTWQTSLEGRRITDG